jgi:hypothetical protein
LFKVKSINLQKNIQKALFFSKLNNTFFWQKGFLTKPTDLIVKEREKKGESFFPTNDADQTLL